MAAHANMGHWRLRFDWCLRSSCQNTCFRRAARHISGHSTEGGALIDGTILHTYLSLVFSSDLCVWTLRLGTDITRNLFYGSSLWAHSAIIWRPAGQAHQTETHTYTQMQTISLGPR